MAYEVRWSNSRSLPYFYDPSTGQSTWEAPPGVDVSQLPGAHYLQQGGGGAGGQAPAASGGSVGGSGGKQGEIRASHILSKHQGSRRPSSWKEDRITRTLPDARSAIQAQISRLSALPQDQQRQAFAETAATESDCSSAKKGGDLGWFGRGMMQKSFEEAAYSLQVGQMSGVVESDSGVHVILRTG